MYPLPPGLGRMPVTVRDVPALGTQLPGFAIPLHQREAMWLAFGGSCWHPHAVQVSVGGINAIDGAKVARRALHRIRKIISSHRLSPGWMGSILARATYANSSLSRWTIFSTIEAQLSGSLEKFWRSSASSFSAEALGVFPECESPLPPIKRAAGVSMGLGVGGKIAQRIYADPHGLETWDTYTPMTLWIQILNSIQFKFLSGVQAPPPSVITSETHAKYQLPWFELYDEDQKALGAERAARQSRSHRRFN